MRKQKFKIFLLILLIPVFIFFGEFAVLSLRENYCESVANKLSQNEKLAYVEPLPEQKAIGVEKITKYYEVKSNCESKIAIPTPLFDYLNKRLP